jgi:hypothetical protein
MTHARHVAAVGSLHRHRRCQGKGAKTPDGRWDESEDHGRPRDELVIDQSGVAAVDERGDGDRRQARTVVVAEQHAGEHLVGVERHELVAASCEQLEELQVVEIVEITRAR